MTTRLTLDALGASDALARCYRLLRHWAAEAQEKQETADGDEFGDLTPAAAGDTPTSQQECHAHSNITGPEGQEAA